MGELSPLLMVALAVLAIIMIVVGKTQLSRRGVVRPLDQEDRVTRVRMRLSGPDAKRLGNALLAAEREAYTTHRSAVVEQYEGYTERLLRFEVLTGVKPGTVDHAETAEKP